MSRYQVVYSKGFQSMVSWTDTLAKAAAMARGFRSAGYQVSVWECGKTSARLVEV